MIEVAIKVHSSYGLSLAVLKILQFDRELTVDERKRLFGAFRNVANSLRASQQDILSYREVYCPISFHHGLVSNLLKIVEMFCVQA